MMTPQLFLAIAFAGGLGAACRFAFDGALRGRISARGGSPALPWGTIVINLSGSLALGVLAGFAAGSILPEPWLPIIGTGFLGGYTTFSTASFETVQLLRERRRGAALVNGPLVLVAATGLAGLGLWLGSMA